MSQGRLNQILAKSWRATQAGPFFETSKRPKMLIDALPKDYLEVIGEFGGREGFLGDTYLRLYQREELAALNFAYQVPTLVPEILIFGSNASGEAFAFDLEASVVVQVPFIPLISDHKEVLAESFTEFTELLVESGASEESNPDSIGLEVHLITPLCFGGNPTAKSNKIMIPVSKHVEVSMWWNEKYQNALKDLKKSKKKK